jgi:hypothetical protein
LAGGGLISEYDFEGVSTLEEVFEVLRPLTYWYRMWVSTGCGSIFLSKSQQQ